MNPEELVALRDLAEPWRGPDELERIARTVYEAWADFEVVAVEREAELLEPDVVALARSEFGATIAAATIAMREAQDEEARGGEFPWAGQ